MAGNQSTGRSAPLARRLPALQTVTRAAVRALHQAGAEDADILDLVKIAITAEQAASRAHLGRGAAAEKRGVSLKSVERAWRDHGPAEQAAWLRALRVDAWRVVNEARERLTAAEIHGDLADSGRLGSGASVDDVAGVCRALVAEGKLVEHPRAGGRPAHYSVEGIDAVRWVPADRDEALRGVGDTVDAFLSAAVAHAEALQLGTLEVTPDGVRPTPAWDGVQVRTVHASTVRDPAAARKELATLLQTWLVGLDQEPGPPEARRSLTLSLGLRLDEPLS